MGTITTKFSVGDTVYKGWTTVVQKKRPCPDCQGSRKWRATSPAGGEYTFDCPRCCANYQSNQALSLSYAAHEPLVEKLTIGQVRAQDGGDPRAVEYMCHETGIGSGTLHSEDALFQTEAEAHAAAEILAKARDESSEWIVKLFDQSLKLSDYQLSDAVKKAAEDAEISRQVRVSMLFDDLREAQDLDEVKRAMENYSERRAAA